MSKHHIELTADEARDTGMITFNVKKLNHAELRRAVVANEEPIARLMQSLHQRNAIPEPRRRYWEDPECNIGGNGKSRRSVFERNGRRGNDIYTHPHFLPHLRYFLFGAELDEAVMREFEDQVEGLEPITSGDLEPIRACVRRLTRQHQLDRKPAAEEFFKLCLDMELGVIRAAAVRETVMKTR